MIRAWAPLVLLAAASSCGGPVPAEQPSTEQAAPIVTVAAVASASPSPAPTVSATVAAVAARPPKLAPRASTPGKVQCDTVDCDLATQVCCLNAHPGGGDVGRCVAKATAPDVDPCCVPNRIGFCGNDSMTTQRTCDEAADCSGGKRCCVFGAGEGDLVREMCDSECFAEKCLPGGTCPNGNACAAEEAATGGECPLQIKPPKCGAATCKMGEQCCWNVDDKRGQCAKACSATEDAWVGCSSPDQCGSYACNSYIVKPPRYVCGGDGFFASVLCSTIKDCPKQLNSLGFGPGLPTVKSCKHTAELPPGVKECQYE